MHHHTFLKFISANLLPILIFVLGLGVVSFGPWFGALLGDMANNSVVVALLSTVIGGVHCISVQVSCCEYACGSSAVL